MQRACHRRKRHKAWANTPRIVLLDRGKLSKQQRDACVVKTTVKTRKADGSYWYSGNRFLKQTQPTPQVSHALI